MGESVNVDNDRDLSLVAVGLWHRLASMGGGICDKAALLTVQQSPNAWGPFEDAYKLEDVDSALDELLAIGYVEEISGDRLRLYYTRDI